MSAWINSGFSEYAKRIPKSYQINLIEIPAIKRTKAADIKQIIKKESQELLEAVPKDSLIIVLDEHGKEWTTLELTKKLNVWYDKRQDISFLIGGPDGLSADCLQNAHMVWSLSKLTMPHQLVRVFVVEQIYRAWSITSRHPYHRN